MSGLSVEVVNEETLQNNDTTNELGSDATNESVIDDYDYGFGSTI